LEEGTAGFAFASGMAAITAVLSLFRAGDRILISSNVYGGTYRVLDRVFSAFDLRYAIVNTEDLTALPSQITPDVKAILVESPANPLMTITDIRGMAAIAGQRGILTIVDNTFMTPYLQKPLTLGADIVLHSGTKYLGGHSDVVAGLVAVKNQELAKRLAFIQNATGGVLGPQDSFLIIRGIKTLAVRMDRHVENAEKVARFLKDHPAVDRVYYPGLSDAQGYDVNRRQAKNGGVMISFVLDSGHDYRKFVSSLKLIALAESLGGVESLVCHPATMTHASIPKEIREQVGITDNLIRLSTGIEHVDDLLADLEQAIKASEV
jgi:cystathionine beta-lyase